MDCSLPGSYVHGISQTRILKRPAISFSRISSQPRELKSAALAGGFFTTKLSEKPTIFHVPRFFKNGLSTKEDASQESFLEEVMLN